MSAPPEDPLLSALGKPTEPDDEKRKPSDESSEGTPRAGESVVSQAPRKGIFGFLNLLGPGLVTGASDDDPSGIGTYSQVGSQFGLGLLWSALFTFPLMAAVQEACGRIALETGVGLGKALRRKFPTWLVGIAILAMLIANTINVGADLGAVGAGIVLLVHGSALWFVGPVAIVVVALQLFVNYSAIFRIFKWLTLALFAYVITAFVVHPNALTVLKAAVVPHFEWNAQFITAFVAILGTTISPYLFFWQASSEVDEMKAAGKLTEAERRGVKAKELRHSRIDIFTGMFFSQIVMFFIILTSATVFNAHGQTSIQTADQAAEALAPLAGRFAFLLFALGLIGTGLLAIPILTGSAAYALKEFLNLPGSLASKPKHHPTFYGIIVIATFMGVAMNFFHFDPIKALFITAVINGLVAPPLLILIALLAADKKQMKRRASGRLSQTLTWLAAAVMSAGAVALIWTTFFVHN